MPGNSDEPHQSIKKLIENLEFKPHLVKAKIIAAFTASVLTPLLLWLCWRHGFDSHHSHALLLIFFACLVPPWYTFARLTFSNKPGPSPLEQQLGLSQAKQIVANLEPLPISISNIAKNEEVGCFSITCKVTDNNEDKEGKEEKRVNNFVVMKASSNSDWRKILKATQAPLHNQSQHKQPQSEQMQQGDSQIQYPLSGYLFSTSNKEPVAMSIGTDVAWIL